MPWEEDGKRKLPLAKFFLSLAWVFERLVTYCQCTKMHQSTDSQQSPQLPR